jgi:ketosteroid isomerase-like protein
MVGSPERVASGHGSGHNDLGGGAAMVEKHAIVLAVTDMVDAVNRGDFASAIAAFSDAPAIVEDVAPFRWKGAGSVSAWLSAMGANAARLDVQAVVMELGQPTRIELDGEAAYALFPGRLKLAKDGGDLVADGTLTFTLERAGGRWLVDTLAWSGPEPAAR